MRQIENCNILTAEQKYVTEQLNKRYHYSTMTVASKSTLAPDQFDFKTLMEALLWVKMIGAEENQPNGIRLVLDTGNHIITDNDVLNNGLVAPRKQKNVLLYLSDINLEITSRDKDKTLIEIETESRKDLIFDRSRIHIEDVSFRTTGYYHKTTHHFVFTGSEAHLQNINLQDIGTIAVDGSTVEFYGNVHVCSDYTKGNDFVFADKNSFVKLEKVDFNDHELKITAINDSRIYMHSCVNTDELKLNLTINRRGKDLSIIYDEIRGDADKFDLAYKAAPDHGLVSNTAGNGFIIPLVDKFNAGLIDPKEYKKLQEMREQWNPCAGSMTIYDIDVGTKELRRFTMQAVLVKDARVFVNGVLIRSNEYRLLPSRDPINQNNDITVIEFRRDLKSGDWIAVEYMI